MNTTEPTYSRAEVETERGQRWVMRSLFLPPRWEFSIGLLPPEDRWSGVGFRVLGKTGDNARGFAFVGWRIGFGVIVVLHPNQEVS